ncbi:hypothetical protein JCM3766R1_000589 [Sporobolomyces carnicolor]
MPGLLTLPDEVLLLILREPSLTYNDLKRLSRVSKKLHSLEQVRLSLLSMSDGAPHPKESDNWVVQDKSLDLKMFRMHLQDPSSSSNEETVELCQFGVDVKCHPVLDKANLLATAFEDVNVFYNIGHPARTTRQGNAGHDASEGQKGDFRKVKISDLACVHETATSPPCRALYFKMGASPRADNDTGVTVQDAVFAAVEMWGAEPDDPALFDELAADMLCDPYQWDGMTWKEMLNEGCRWKGVRKACVVYPDFVSLEPHSFYGK